MLLRAEKAALRKAVLAVLRELPGNTRLSQSQIVTQRLLASPSFKACRRVGVFVSCDRLFEVNTLPIISALLTDPERSCFVPLVSGKHAMDMNLIRIDSLSDLIENDIGILEPSPGPVGAPREDALRASHPLDLIIVPGIAFDTSGRRCGRGGGYYDALLAASDERGRLRKETPPFRVALAFDQQVVHSVPSCDGHDATVDIVLTPTQTHLCSAGAHKFRM